MSTQLSDHSSKGYLWVADAVKLLPQRKKLHGGFVWTEKSDSHRNPPLFPQFVSDPITSCVSLSTIPSSACSKLACLWPWKSHLALPYCRFYQCKASPSGSKQSPRRRRIFCWLDFPPASMKRPIMFRLERSCLLSSGWTGDCWEDL